MPLQTAIIIPCFNEEQRLDHRRILDFLRQHPEITCIPVDDGSTDATWPALNELAARLPGQVQPLRLQHNQGKAEAVRQGFIAASQGQFAHIGYWDADLATPLELVPDFVKHLDRLMAVAVLGSRIKYLGAEIDRHVPRHFGGRIFATVVSNVLGLAVYDTQCGAKLFRNTASVRRVFKLPFQVGWIFDVEIIARLLVLRETDPEIEFGRTIVELPLPMWRDVPGSKVRPRDFFTSLWQLRRIRRFLTSPERRDAFLRETGD